MELPRPLHLPLGFPGHAQALRPLLDACFPGSSPLITGPQGLTRLPGVHVHVRRLLPHSSLTKPKPGHFPQGFMLTATSLTPSISFAPSGNRRRDCPVRSRGVVQSVCVSLSVPLSQTITRTDRQTDRQTALSAVEDNRIDEGQENRLHFMPEEEREIGRASGRERV